jgi:DNA-binding IclR family transcriptional regulator
MDAVKQILDAMKAAGEPLAAGKIVEMTGLDRAAVDAAMAALKKSGEIESPVRCKWQPKA